MIEVRWGNRWFPAEVRDEWGSWRWVSSPAFKGLKLMKPSEWREKGTAP